MLLKYLDKIEQGEAVTAEQLREALRMGYAIWQRGRLVLTDYGQQVLATLANAA
jgi:hypothetical protein